MATTPVKDGSFLKSIIESEIDNAIGFQIVI